MKTTNALFVAVTSFLLFSEGPAQTSSVPWSALSMGHAVASSRTTIVKSVVGQTFVGLMQGSSSIIESGFLTDTLFRSIPTDVAAWEDIPREYELRQNYPNPFNPSTTIRFELPRGSMVTLKVYNILGQEVVTLLDEDKPAGIFDVQFSAANMSSGIYVYRLQAKDFVSTRRMLLLK